MPPELAGRDDLLAEVGQQVTRAAHFGRGSGPIVWTGVRGVGKTVALVQSRSQAGAQGFASAHVTADRSGGLTDRVARAVAGALATADVERRGKRWERLTERLSAFRVEISVGGVVSVAASGNADPAPRSGANQDLLRDLIIDATTQIIEAGRSGLLLTLDELQEAPIEDLRVMVNVLQELTIAAVPVVCVAAGLPMLPERLMDAGSFAERFAFRRIGNLDTGDALTALIRPADTLRVHWDQDAADTIVQVSGGSPFLLQLYADAAWQQAAPRPDGRIEPPAVEAGVTEAERLLWDGQYRGRWNRATPAEQRVLWAMAVTQDESGVSRTDAIAGVIGRTSPQFSLARAKLIDKGLIEAVGHGQLAFTVPGFERFVRAQATSPTESANRPKPDPSPLLPPTTPRRELGGPDLGR